MGFLPHNPQTDTLLPVHGSSLQLQHATHSSSRLSGRQGERESEFTSSSSSGHTAQDFSKHQVDGEDERLGSGVRETYLQIPLSICSSVISSKTLCFSGPSFSKNIMKIITLPILWPVMTMKLKKKKKWAENSRSHWLLGNLIQQMEKHLFCFTGLWRTNR